MNKILIFDKMQNWIAISLLIIAIMYFLTAVYFTLTPATLQTDIPIEKVDEPKNKPVSTTDLEEIADNPVCSITEYDQPPDDTDGPSTQDERDQLEDAQQTVEDFRIYGGGGGRGGMGWGGRGGMGGGLPWRPWPNRHWERPWRTRWWGAYPEYVYTYPLTYYTNEWTAPVERFIVRIGPKGDRHPFAGEGSDLGYMITRGYGSGCGTSGARLDLQRGKTYEFDVYTGQDCVTGQKRDQPFFFTTDKDGGARIGEIFDINPTVNGTIRITITEDLPNEFYYQSTRGRNIGGHVILHS